MFKQNKVLLFLNDDEQETRYITAELKNECLTVCYTNFDHITPSFTNEYVCKFNSYQTNKLVKTLNCKSSNILNYIKSHFNTSSASANIMKFANIHSIKYKFIFGSEYNSYYRYNINDSIYLTEDILRYKNGEVIVPLFYKHPKNGTQKIYTDKGMLYYTIPYKNNKIDGEVTSYTYNSKNLAFKDMYANGKLNGICEKYYESGEVETQEHFVNGVKDGELVEYSKKGDITSIVMWSKNMKQGKAKHYDENNLVYQCTYVNNEEHGISKCFYKTGELKCKYKYNNGKLLKETYYFKNGKERSKTKTVRGGWIFDF